MKAAAPRAGRTDGQTAPQPAWAWPAGGAARLGPERHFLRWSEGLSPALPRIPRPSRPRAGQRPGRPLQSCVAGGLSEPRGVPESQGAKGSFPALRKNPGKGRTKEATAQPPRATKGVTLPW